MTQELIRSKKVFERVGFEVVFTNIHMLVFNPQNKRKVKIIMLNQNLCEVIAYNNNTELQRKKVKYNQKRIENIVDYIL